MKTNSPFSITNETPFSAPTSGSYTFSTPSNTIIAPAPEGAGAMPFEAVCDRGLRLCLEVCHNRVPVGPNVRGLSPRRSDGEGRV